MGEPDSDNRVEEGVYEKAKASRFQFKTKSESRSKRSRRDDDEDGDSGRHHRHSKRRRKHREHERTFSRTGDYDNPDHRHRESLFDDLNSPSTNVDAEAMFRESIFDAMADDEGADYWEGVYGQPVHIYPNTKPGPDGTLERMSDEEYADFVRTKMWEKSHQHILEERAARERARRNRKEQNRRLDDDVAREEEERENIRRQMKESLQRGADRKRAREAEASWSEYLTKWHHLKSLKEPGLESPRDIIPWPVASGRASHVEAKAVEQFLKSSTSWREDALAFLKAERVRWHPDKMQQRFGQHIEAQTMKLVTAVFQVIDRLWNERNLRSK